MDRNRWKNANPTTAHRVVALAYPDLCLFEFGIAAELFGLSRPELSMPWYAFRVAGTSRRLHAAVGNLHVQTDGGLVLLDDAQTIVIPGWSGPDVIPSRPLKNALIRAHERGARFLTICSGAFLLGHCGLLDGAEATTHWRHEARFQELFPRTRLVRDALYVESGQIVTSAGSAAGIDAGLHLIRQDHGTRIANQVAQRLVMPPHRQGDARQYVPSAVQARRHDRFDAVFDWARDRLDRSISVAELADKAAMSIRNFHRRFQDTVGMTPAAWLLEERLRVAREHLEASGRPLNEVAEAAGFPSLETFRSAFRRRVGVSPSAYRNHFRGLADQPRGSATRGK